MRVKSNKGEMPEKHQAKRLQIKANPNCKYCEGKGYYCVANGPDDFDKEVCWCVMTYTCDKCHKENCDDNGPYECADGEYQCQQCMEGVMDANNQDGR